MIVVTVELWSAITGQRSQLAKMHICNEGTSDNPRVGNYRATTFVGRDEGALSRGTVSKIGTFGGWRRLDYHIWNLVRRALEECGYNKGLTFPKRTASVEE